MAEYLDGGRIQGSTTAPRTTTLTSNLSSDSGWEQDGSAIFVNESGSYIDSDNNGGSTTHQALFYDLGSALSTSWVIDLDLYVTNSSNSNSNWTHIGMHDVDQDTDDDDDQNFLGINAIAEYTQISTGNGNYLGIMHNQNTTLGNASPTGVSGDGNEIATGAQFYLRLIRDGNTLKLERHATSSRTGSTLTTTRSITMTAGLQYFGISHRSRTHSGRMDLKIENVKIWDGTTTTTVDEKTTITNVPSGTRYEETDTRKIYRYNTDVGLKASMGNLDDGINMTAAQDTGWFQHVGSGSALIGVKVSKIGLSIIKQSGASGTGVAGVWDSTDKPNSSDLVGSAKHVFASLNISTIGTAYVPDKTFGTGGDFDTNSDGEYTLQEGDYIGFCILGASGQLNIKGSYAGDTFDGTATQLAYSNTAGNFTDQSPTDDLYLKLYATNGWLERGTAV